MEATAGSLPQIASTIRSHLNASDDPDLWQMAVERIIADAEFLCYRCSRRNRIFAQIGSCSHLTAPKREMLQGYAFAKVNDRWQYVASSGDRRPYERVSNDRCS
jgi:hypothetical protein